jgi:hypothetical protein
MISKDDPLYVLIARRFDALRGLAQAADDSYARVDLEGAERCLGSVILKAAELQTAIRLIASDSEQRGSE